MGNSPSKENIEPGGSGATTGSPTKRAVDNTQPHERNPIKVKSAKLLGNQTADNSASHRDLGFTGKVAGKWYAIYGDTLWCAPGVKDPSKDDPDVFHGMVRDSVSLITDDPLKVHDLYLNDDEPVPHQKQFVPFNSDWGETNTWGFGGTSLCETDADAKEAILYYLRNANEDGLKGAGVARVQVKDGTPYVVKRYGNSGYWWDSSKNPQYGDILAYADERSDYIYAVGNPPTTYKDFPSSQYAYMARVKRSDAFDLSSYQYWHGLQSGWSSAPLTAFNPETAVFWGCGQGQILWSPYYELYVFVHLTLDGKKVLLRTAKRPEGPWSADVTAHHTKAEGAAYAGVAHPLFDASGKTLIVSYTRMPNVIEVVKITFV